MPWLVDAYKPMAHALHPRILTCAPRPLTRALLRICTGTCSILVVSWLAGRISHSHAADSGTFRPLLQMLQFLPCFTAATSLTPAWMVPGHPNRLASANPSTASTCTWRHFDTTPPDEPYSAHDLPWLHTIHRLLLCLAFRPGSFSVPQFCSEMLPLAWARLGILAPLLPIYGSSPQFQPSRVRPLLTSTLVSSACSLIPWL
jgi:hypothetical protein